MVSSRVVILCVVNGAFLIANISIIFDNSLSSSLSDEASHDSSNADPERMGIDDIVRLEQEAIDLHKIVKNAEEKLGLFDINQEHGRSYQSTLTKGDARSSGGNSYVFRGLADGFWDHTSNNKKKRTAQLADEIADVWTDRAIDSLARNIREFQDFTKKSFTETRKSYVVPTIPYTKLANCSAMLSGNQAEITRAKLLMDERKYTKIPISEEQYDEWTENCEQFISDRGYITIPLTEEEQQYPLAFSIAMYTDVEQFERLLRAIYQPQNMYCIHIDIKTSVLIHRTVRKIANCFPNVWIASHLDKIKWGDVSILYPALNCMRDMIKHHKNKWKYYINLTGQEFPLRTNLELVKVAKVFNGSNDIAGSTATMEPERVNFQWTHRWSRTYQQTIFYNTFKKKEANPDRLKFYKGELHGFFSHNMVDYIINNATAQRYLKWVKDTGHPSEHYWNVLNYNQQLAVPGGYMGSEDVANAYAPEPIVRAKHWEAINYGDRKCGGKVVRGICVYGVSDLPWLHHRPELAANKFHLTYQHLTLDCLEERHRNRTRQQVMDRKVGPWYKAEEYQQLPTVVYGRKDGVSGH